jgi:hypothetical protein
MEDTLGCTLEYGLAIFDQKTSQIDSSRHAKADYRKIGMLPEGRAHSSFRASWKPDITDRDENDFDAL